MCRCVYLLVLLFSTFSGLSSSPAVTRTVRPGENITLPCSIFLSTEMVWYRQINDELTLIISVIRGHLKTYMQTNYNKDSEHFILLVQNNASPSLTIVNIRQSDIGQYYCGARQDGSFNFSRAVQLHLADTVKYIPGDVQCWTPLISVCCGLALMLMLCLGVVYKRGLPSCCCMKDEDMKEADLHYASLRHSTSPRERRAPPAIHNNVLYDTVGKKLTKTPSV
ncbi:uncharacterized protein Hap1MRO34_003358 [Clarias gariepinus]